MFIWQKKSEGHGSYRCVQYVQDVRKDKEYRQPKVAVPEMSHKSNYHTHGLLLLRGHGRAISSSNKFQYLASLSPHPNVQTSSIHNTTNRLKFIQARTQDCPVRVSYNAVVQLRTALARPPPSGPSSPSPGFLHHQVSYSIAVQLLRALVRSSPFGPSSPSPSRSQRHVPTHPRPQALSVRHSSAQHAAHARTGVTTS
ncbi:hypothetical protein DUNSADRAFT_2051 [Dunaliella salina]|uniref:Encoded protein n=1 Tax=Dunaliella salina TaxID=3046 RepID=A0ABQ7GW94_DUNSA|nr:hypothetical protein DUNSADRAFT_2051 [Dunaliella salina]|eukprot:KAF5838882.1 hypothetical protein DUNSADRAFT_2051 [Dunaliella salina]